VHRHTKEWIKAKGRYSSPARGPSQKKARRGRRRSDPLADLWDAERQHQLPGPSPYSEKSDGAIQSSI
jgi:hypothetical protein